MKKTFVFVLFVALIGSMAGGYFSYRFFQGNEKIVIREKEYVSNDEKGVEEILKNLKKSEVHFDVQDTKEAKTEMYTGYYISNDGFVILPYIQSVIDEKSTLSFHENNMNSFKIYPDPLKNFIIISLTPSENKLVKPIEFESEISQYPGKKVFTIEYTSLFQHKFFESYITEFIPHNSVIYGEYSLDRPLSIERASFVFNYDGKLIGVTTTEDKKNSSFTALSRMNSILESIEKNNSIRYPNFPFTLELNYFEGYPLHYGAVIKSISENNSNTNILVGDIIFEINNKEIEEYKTFFELISENLPGDTVQLKIFRYNDAVSKEQGDFHESFEKQTFEIPIVLSEF